MKQQRYRYKLIAFILSLSLLGLVLWGAWSVRQYGNRWFSYGSNTRLIQQKKTVTAGKILDRNGITLASTDQGQRVYRDKPEDRSALVHILGDRSGQIANGLESFQAGYLYGYQSSLLDSIHQLISKSERIGNTLNLTIDADLCTFIQESFAQHAETSGHSGAAVVMNYQSGEILAFVSLPNFDPDTVSAQQISVLDHPYWNRATQALYPPGSTFKTVTAAAILKQQPEVVSRTFTCTGQLNVTDHFTVHDFQNAAHGELSLRQAFLHSCNSVFATCALELGSRAMLEEAQRFGFNQNFLFRDLVLTNSSYPTAEQDLPSLAASGYGQASIAATPLHMCLIACAIANRGIMQEPRLLKTVRSASGAVILPWSESAVRTVCEPAVAEQLQSMMKDVVQGGGSGSRAMVTTLDIRGKTGTAQSTDKGGQISYGWFIGFNAQADLPIALAVLVENIPDGATGGTTAALPAKDIFTYVKNHPDRVR